MKMKEEVDEDKSAILQKLKQIAGVNDAQQSQPIRNQTAQSQVAKLPVAEDDVLRRIKERINFRKILIISFAVLVLIILAFLAYYFFTSDFYNSFSKESTNSADVVPLGKGEIPEPTDIPPIGEELPDAADVAPLEEGDLPF